ncbi:CC/Se motif family (seleno)protein [Clostridium formicaceticum]|uniref:Uncharacterized protein n=1 Tax=Clostridium formicaceticum TaxID=1497 RepID=A0AAC9WGT8_9CLOT|nr:CC/Se motif family (seleno)protein [Clostridium formicaceticum]AOY77748.1 hypothetical protein BJL90_18925 [Clostridium formicaceticum]ARE88347.1 hypothetical protein CLFO_27480 [Clostridium formicaceticum]
MKFQVAPESEGYILQKNEPVMIMLSNMGGCCGGSALIPKIELGSPKNLTSFKITEVGKITIYYDKGIKKVKKIKIGLSKLFWFKKLTIEFIE